MIDPETGLERPGMSVDDLIAELRRTPDLSACFGEASGNAKPVKAVIADPWRTGPTFNVTEQSKLLRVNPTLAAQLQEEATLP